MEAAENPQEKFLKRYYLKILKSCHSKFAPYILGVLSFTESCFFIIPPEVLLLPMCYANKRRSFFYAAITTITSVLGAVAGYFLGMYLWAEVRPLVFQYVPGFSKNFEHVGVLYENNAVSALFLAAFTPIPFKVFTVAAGVYSTKITLLTLIATSLVGRGARYGILAGIVYIFGDRAHVMIEKHFRLASLVIMVVGVGGIIFLKVLR